MPAEPIQRIWSVKWEYTFSPGNEYYIKMSGEEVEKLFLLFKEKRKDVKWLDIDRVEDLCVEFKDFLEEELWDS